MNDSTDKTDCETASCCRKANPVEYAVPSANLHQTEKGFVLEIEMPGVNKTGVDLSVEDGKLTITGVRQPAKAGHYLHKERQTLDYRRVFDLDPTIDPSMISASMEQGLLCVTLQKAAVHQPRKINIS